MYPMAKRARKIVSLAGMGRFCVTYVAMRRSPRIDVSIVVGVRFMIGGGFLWSGAGESEKCGIRHIMLCPEPESNWRPPTFQADALPTELSGLKLLPSIRVELAGSQVPSSPATRVMFL